MKITDEMLFDHAAQARNIWLNTLPSDEDLPAATFSKSFERKMRKLIRQQRRTPRANQILRAMRHTAAAILLIAIVTFGGLMTVEAYREKVIDLVMEVFEEFTRYQFSSDASEEVDAKQTELPQIQFGYIPEGMQETENSTNPAKILQMTYEDDQDHFFEFTVVQLVNGEYDTILDTENSDYYAGTINGCEAFFNSKGADSSIVWVDDALIYELYGNIDMGQLKTVAENIKISPSEVSLSRHRVS